MWNSNAPLSSPSSVWHHKRKCDMDMDVIAPPLKMHITEEKMVSQLNGIHLSNSYTTHGSGTLLEDSGISLKTFNNRSDGPSNALPSLKICEEIKALDYCKLDPGIPDSLLYKFSKTSTALVLWKPPIGSIARSLSAPASNEESSTSQAQPSALPEVVDVEMNEDDDDDNNNNVRSNAEPGSAGF